MLLRLLVAQDKEYMGIPYYGMTVMVMVMVMHDVEHKATAKSSYWELHQNNVWFSEKVWKWITLSDSVDVTKRISTFSHQWVVIRWGLAEPLIDAASQTRELHSPDNIFWLLSTPPLGSEETKKSGSLRPTLTNDPQPLGLSSPKMICTEDVIVSNSAFSFVKHFCLHESVE